MKLLLLSLSCLLVNALAFEVKIPTLYEGVSYFYQWMPEDKKLETVQKSKNYAALKKRGIDVLGTDGKELIWAEQGDTYLSYYFYTVTPQQVTEKFIIQKIKKTVQHIKNGEVYKEEVTYLVEAFKPWSGLSGDYTALNGLMKKADSHWGSFSHLGKNRKKVIFKEFETGVGTITGLAEDTTKWFGEEKTLYWGTKYIPQNEYYDKVNFTDSTKWTLNVEVTKDSYLIESPELGLKKQN